MNALVVLNPHARGGTARRLIDPLQRNLAALDRPVAWCAHERWEDSLAQIQACPPGGRIVMVGGDGTVNRYLPALLAGRHSLGIVPSGSGNDLARAMALDPRRSWAWCLRHALQGPLRALDVGLAELEDGRRVPFLSSLTMGFDTSVARRAQQSPAWLWGLPRYLFALARELRELRRWPVVVEADETHFAPGEVLLASVLNTPTFGGGLPAVPQACPDDGWLNLLVARRMGRAGVLKLALQMLRGTHLGNPAVWQKPVRRLVLRGTQPLPIAADGNDLGDAHTVKVTLNGERLPVVAAHWRHGEDGAQAGCENPQRF